MFWASTYFGLSGYDGHNWYNYLSTDSGLASDFINATQTRGDDVWACTDKGLSYLNFKTNTWVTYRPNKETGKGEIVITTPDKKVRYHRDAYRSRSQLRPQLGVSRRRHLGGHGRGAEPRNP